MTVLVVGDLNTDVLAGYDEPLATGTDTPARIRLAGGGSAANTAAWLAHLRVPVRLVAVVGDDAAGTDRVAELAALGVECAVRRTGAAATGAVVVLVRDGERTMLTERGANLLLAPQDIDAALPGARHLHLSGYPLLDAASRPAGRHALAAARAAGLSTSVDVASAGPLRRVGGAAFLSWVGGTDLLLANLDEARALLADAEGGTAGAVYGGPQAGPAGSTGPGPLAEAAALARRLTGHARYAVVKCGAAGAAWAGQAGGPVVTSAAAEVDMVDVTGAGDAFAAGVLAAWHASPGPDGLSCAPDPVRALRRGVRCGAEAVSRVGARPAT